MSLGTAFLWVVNSLLLGAAGYAIWRFRKEDRLREGDERRIKELAGLRDSIDQLLGQALVVSNKLSEEIERKGKLVSELVDKLEREKTARSTGILEPDAALPNLQPRNKEKTWSEDKYSEAFRLAEEGLSLLEISRKVDIPLGEIELAINLRKQPENPRIRIIPREDFS
ncbi:MAG: hypothetical protein ACE5GQ_02700 [Nitrospinales bacterium]